jgi:aromatic-L-amino-acid/L-tryptophan decarboxylase
MPRKRRAPPQPALDPPDWRKLRAEGHRMLDDMLDYIESIRSRPVWQPMSARVREAFHRELPSHPAELRAVYADFLRDVVPYCAANVHPRFMGWVQGGGTAIGMLAEMLAGALNANCGGRDHAPIEVEQQIVEWCRRLFGFPRGASGLFVGGTSMANLLAVLVARRSALGPAVRRAGLGAADAKLVAYASVATHACVARAMDIAGLGTEQLRLLPVDAAQRIELDALRRAIDADRGAGRTPFLLVGNAGTVDIGAIDDLTSLADLAAAERLWLHVDGAFGALGLLAPEIAPRLAGIERADSLAFDFHKWGQVPYDAGFVLVRDGALHRDTFATPAEYLRRATRGIAAGELWPTDLGPDLSRGFRALKTWFTLRVYGTRQLGAAISRTCEVARYLAARVAGEVELELLAPVPLNIVCFRYRAPGADVDSDELNAAIAADVQESGIAAPSTTRIGGKLAIRAAIFNHRTRESDADALVAAVLEHGGRRVRSSAGRRAARSPRSARAARRSRAPGRARSARLKPRRGRE